MNLRVTEFQIWKKPGRVGQLLRKLIARGALDAEKLGKHARANNPVLSSGQIRQVVQYVRNWAFSDWSSRQRYAQHFLKEPENNDQHMRAFARSRDMAMARFQWKVRLELRLAEQEGVFCITDECFVQLWQLAENYKNWIVRDFSDHTSGSVAERRAEWYLVEFLSTWSRDQ